MPIELVSRVNLDQLHLPFMERVLSMLAACRSRGALYYAISGYRSDAEQLKLWTQGRTQPGPIVTDAGPGESAHNYGIAIDFCRDGLIDRAGLQPDWRAESYDILGEEAQAVGLEWGGSWKFKDRPHVQLRGFVTKAELAPLAPIKAVGGLSAVFAHLDALKVAA